MLCLLRLDIARGTNVSCDVPGQDQGQQGSDPAAGLLRGFGWAATQEWKGEAAPQKGKAIRSVIKEQLQKPATTKLIHSYRLQRSFAA